LLQIRKIATILRRFGRANQIAATAALSRRLDHVAIGASGHDAVLKLAGSGQIVREPYPDGKQDHGDDEAGNGTTAIVALVGIRFSH
jgi:hypothetical protein